MGIRYGVRTAGRVDGHGGEFAHTTFVHLYYFPFFPQESRWVTDSAGEATAGFPIPMHGRSLVATYVRWYAPLLAAIAIANGPLVSRVVIGSALLAATAWAWWWRFLRTDTARLRSDYNLLAFGSRCPPEAMSVSLRDTLAAQLDAQWRANVAGGRTPDDVARFGATSAAEAVLAYGLLALAGVDDRAARAAADRMMRGPHDPVPASDGPYRDVAPCAPKDLRSLIAAAAAVPGAAVGIAALTRAAATNIAFAVDASDTIAARRSPRLRSRTPLIAFAAVALAITSAIGLAYNLPACPEPQQVTLAELADGHDHGELVSITCGSTMKMGSVTRERAIANQVYGCLQGSRILAVRASSDATELPEPLIGRLVPAGPHDIWFAQFNSHVDLMPMYVRPASVFAIRLLTAAFALAGLVAAALGTIVLRRYRRRNKRR